MSTHSPLFERITTCSNAIRFLNGNEEHVSSYEEVRRLVPQERVTRYKTTNIIRASLEFLKSGLRGGRTDARKANIAMYVAVLIADDQDKDGLAKEVCERFRGIDDFDRTVMTKIFRFSICNDRVRALLDSAMLRKTKNIYPAIDREFRVEFIVLFFNVMKSMVRRGQPLTGLGGAAGVTPSHMEAARVIIDEHVSSIATKCWPCFNHEALKKPRVQNNLFPACGALPSVSIGCDHIDFDQATCNTLKDSLFERKEKDVFVGIICAIISVASSGPVATYDGIKSEVVKVFFMETVLDKAQADEVKKSVSALAEQSELHKENSSLKDQVSSLKKANKTMYDKYLEVAKMYSSKRDEWEDLKEANKLLKNMQDHAEKVIERENAEYRAKEKRKRKREKKKGEMERKKKKV